MFYDPNTNKPIQSLHGHTIPYNGTTYVVVNNHEFISNLHRALFFEALMFVVVILVILAIKAGE